MKMLKDFGTYIVQTQTAIHETEVVASMNVLQKYHVVLRHLVAQLIEI